MAYNSELGTVIVAPIADCCSDCFLNEGLVNSIDEDVVDAKTLFS